MLKLKQYNPGDKIYVRCYVNEVNEATIVKALPRTGEGYYEFELTRKGKTFCKRDHCSYFVDKDGNYITPRI